MELAFFVSLNAFLISRIPFLQSDRPIKRLHCVMMIVIQFLPLLVFKAHLIWYLAYAVLILLINTLLFFAEAVKDYNLDGLRATSLSAIIIIFGILHSSAIGPEFNIALIESLGKASSYFAPFSLVESIPTSDFLILVSGFLLVTFETNLPIRYALEKLELISLKQNDDTGTDKLPTPENQFSGRYIGIFERTLLFVFLLNGAYTAMAFVVLIKSFTRSEIKHEFADYVLTGTLLSAAVAVLISLLTLELLKAVP